MSDYSQPMFYGARARIFGFANALRKRSTPAEKLLWKALRNRQVGGLKFRRQHSISHYIADFYCAEHKLVVEVDGGIHLKPEVKEYDERRTREMEAMGIRLIRFRNEEVENDIKDVIRRVLEASRV